MTSEQSLIKRQELVESGYTIVPGVMDTDLLDRLKTWSDRIFERVTVPHKIRYQGSDIFVSTERRWQEGAPTVENRFPDPPSWWGGDVPEAVRDADPSIEYEKSHEFRTPSHYLT